MMTGRQRGSGITFNTILVWGVGVVVLLGLPTLLSWWWPNLLVSAKEPWLLDVRDLTWQRVLINMSTKPGFRLMWVGLWTVGFVLFGLLAGSVGKQKRWRARLPGGLCASTEWALDGARRHALSEYGMWVGVI